MGYLYILRCRNERFYIGSTNDLERRLAEHQAGLSRYTSNLLPVELVFSQKYDSLVKARRIEYRLKKLKRRDIIEMIIRDQVIKLES
ncbi:MAG: GIY-YIG protein [uncultured bacterium]|uniref:Excinuclease ABC C subunit domain protein n=1 Tax=Candidatus Daviesbacteria bacterium GW2011_GWC2_40_12 TaxID=1618431 RepID=A0A0G0T1T6_9BACT|nr:MAG: GIY-YIG protein [uncultured bacterium]KKR16720.1 MAG: Excinuclease ABC C subunit domain protein [Candidatus Daviesbacteria bacterium GW2011_GWA2_39_33]KKR25154.1 MAG: Excinuclease ABC C subunit domain protein [Candidatus Daviesbacteria bacterium GW2011_GWB1_39_5]KKR41065.1 MAG: Excinuclease ABC C subunit domain protein [Candidatus Daviesbacteria bacterium GW2011_GWC2_40_12]OGE21208.1 MAG: hypothetical protein A2778_03270 [Candidatus Daviesbacteria bacterium RIFCSPHIGHO2_01_FULL_40_24]O